ncbi:MAG: peptidylprolyl isomerase [Proteobacteria bacterium]|nr:peptidylprolyl isomerase [Pseudomonadota bacterium]MDA0929443.1 peptidylprolyl isomerase [Pseudomonadota bacterium]
MLGKEMLSNNKFGNGVAKAFGSLMMLASLWLGSAAQAQTVVTVTTPLGDFSIQLFDELTPITVSNFLNHVVDGRYNGTFIHRTEPGFVIQGGWLSYNPLSNNVVPLTTDDPILNEPLISNTRGTVAMAKVEGNPNSATSQWFINLDDNSSLDGSNGGFTVFGVVIGDGMTLVDQIANLPAERVINGLGFNVPLINYGGGSLQSSNFVSIQTAITQPYHPNTYNESRNRLNFKVNAGPLGLIGLSFVIESQEPSVVIRALPETVIPLKYTQPVFSTFDTATETLRVPELAIGGSVAYRNLELQLTDPQQLLFTLSNAEAVQ